MYYEKSQTLLEQFPNDKVAIRQIDRSIAHTYVASQSGQIDHEVLCAQTKIPTGKLARFMRLYESGGVAVRFEKVECECGEFCDPQDGDCLNCSEDLSAATASGKIFYRVETQPQKPTFDPDAAPSTCDVFISYRHANCEKLAADIYYSLRSQNQSVFLDNGNLPVGADAEKLYLTAAGRAKYFIALVSEHYFGSPNCKKEIAHAARSGVRMIRVNVPPVPDAPNDLPWIDGPNWNSQKGDIKGLSEALEASLSRAIETLPSTETIFDNRKNGCSFLLNQLSSNELLRVWNNLIFMEDFTPAASKTENIRVILQEATGAKLSLLCNALNPS